MGKSNNNLIFRYSFILYLCIMLLMAQSSGLHLHVLHDHQSPSASSHIVDVHAATALHDLDLHGHNKHGDHHPTAIDIIQDYLVKKTSLLDQLAILVFFIGLFICVPRLHRIGRLWIYKSPVINSHFLLQPPLRAPPTN